MSLLNPNSPTIAERQLQAKNVIIQSIQQLFLQMKNVYNLNFDLVWKHAHLTPQQVVSGLGTSAADVFTYAYMLQNLLNTVVPNTITSTAPMNFTLNQDGTVTLTPIIDPSSSSSSDSSSSDSSSSSSSDSSSSSSSSSS